MRAVDSLLTQAERSGNLKPAIRITIGDITFYNNDRDGMETCVNTIEGVEWTTKRGNRIVSLKTQEYPYGSNKKSELVLLNSDNFLTDMSFKGERVTISWGAETTKGALYSTQPPVYVRSQTLSEREGVNVVALDLLGVTDWLNKDVASCDYMSTGTDTVYQLLVKVLEASISPFDGCKVFNIEVTDYDNSFWSLIPGPAFKIHRGTDTRATVIARLLDLTTVNMRASSVDLIDGKDTVEFFIPSQTVTGSFSLDETDHKYLLMSEFTGIFAPNDITVRNPYDEGTSYTGRARDLPSYDAIPSPRTDFISGLTDTAQANLVANTILANIRAYNEGFSARMPMSFGMELFDRIEVVGRRTGKTVTGNVGAVERVYEPRKGEPNYYISVMTGRWYDPRHLQDVMGAGAGFVNTESESRYEYIYIPCLAFSSKQGDWLGGIFGLELTLFGVAGDDTNGSWVKYKFKAPAGQYKLRFGSYKDSDRGILKTYIDGTLVHTEDCYAVGATYLVVDETVTVPSSVSDWHTLEMLIDGKNASSSGYEVLFGDIVLYPF